MDGKVCVKCGEWKPLEEYSRNTKRSDGRVRHCKACQKHMWHAYHEQNKEELHQKAKAYRERNKDQIRANWKQYYEENKERLRERSRRYGKENPEKRQAARRRRLEADPTINQRNARRWRARNPNRARIASKLWRETYPDRARESYRRWRRKHPETDRIHLRQSGRRRRARERQAEGNHSHAEWLALCAKYDHRCLCCGEQKPLTEDHVIPLALGGTDYITNIQPLCGECNSRKGARIVDYRPTENRPEYHQASMF